MGIRYRKKPVCVDAIRFDGTNGDEIIGVFGPVAVSGYNWRPSGTYEELVIRTLRGHVRAELGDWIVRGVEGEVYPVKNSVFEATYEAAAKPRQEALCVEESELPMTYRQT